MSSNARHLLVALFAALLCMTVVGGVQAPTMAPAVSRPAIDRSLSFEDRVVAQRSIEQVYWQHRIWPKENPGAKPALDAVLPDVQIRAKVEDYLKKSNALEALWQRPIIAAQLQAEMDRMAAQSRAPAVLREIFAALDNDPFVIAETLARQTLADRLIHNWYARDERFHGELRRQAEAALAGVSSGSELSSLGAKYSETTWRLKGEGETDRREVDEDIAARERKPRQIALDAKAWHEQLDRLAGLVGWDGERARAIETGKGKGVTAAADNARASLDSLRLMTVSALQEEDGAFFVTSVIAKGANTVTVATATWPKTAFDAWWGENSAAMSGDLEPAGSAFTLAGITESGTCMPDSWNPSASESPAPSGRYNHTAVWTGSEMIVWGGSDQGDAGGVNTGGRYDPSTDSWVATSTGANVPSGRRSHTAVWTGSEMIVWGGVYSDIFGSVYFDTVGRYNPYTAGWVATSPGPNVPSGRRDHTAVWTGSEMIVWGGTEYRGQSTYQVNTGGRYKPSTDSWVATSIVPYVPSARGWHTAVWTGSEMIVWGGVAEGGGELNTGGRYDPSADSWVATSIVPYVPSARGWHTAVWTGSEMIVWGGGRYTNTGGRYSPSTDSWVATSSPANVPSGRWVHTAVWTGSEMIVWGGSAEGGQELNTGGRYSPSTAPDSWLATSPGANVPSARGWHTAVWTGSEMIVWGGFPTTNTGGSYCVSSCDSPAAWYPDADGDGHGVDSTAVFACTQPPGCVAVGGDCDDRTALCTTECIDADTDGLPVCAGDCNDTIANCTSDCTTDADADGIPDCAEEEVVTIYFGGTKMKSWMWKPADNQTFWRPETVATLHHFETTDPQRGAHHTKGFVEGFEGWDAAFPDWDGQNAIALGILDAVPDCGRECIRLNLVGFSRGGVSALRFAKYVTDSSWPRWQSLKKVNVLAFDPVPGDESGVDNNADWFNLPPGIEYLGFYAIDERSYHFSPAFPALPPSNPSMPRINFFKVRGAHETLVGNTQVNGHNGDDLYTDALKPVSQTLIMTATEMLGSSDWGHVRFRTPSPEELSFGALNLDWYEGETDINELRQDFVSKLAAISAYSDWDYRNMRDHSSTPLLEAWWNPSLGGWDCNTQWLPDQARNNPRCAYYRPSGYPWGSIGRPNWSIDNVSAARPLDTLNDAVYPEAPEYVIWDLIKLHGSLDVDSDLIDYSDDNCPETANPDQADFDGDGWGDVCDCDDTRASCTSDCADVDTDGTPDCADTCPSVANGLQLDADTDGIGDACDCDPDSSGESMMLGPARNLHFTSATGLAWDPPVDHDGGWLNYDLVRTGAAANWGNVTFPIMRTPYTSGSDTEIPTPGGAFFYLVRVRSGCGDNLGTASTEQRRQAAACVLPGKVVFVTSSRHDANLKGLFGGVANGLAGGDAICQETASAAWLVGTFRAWLSDDATSASARLAHSELPYVLVNGTRVADNWADLTDGTLDNPIVIDEHGVSVGSREVWTGTFANGSSDFGHNCSNWSSMSTFNTGRSGVADRMDSIWTSSSTENCLVNLSSLYCIELPPEVVQIDVASILTADVIANNGAPGEWDGDETPVDTYGSWMITQSVADVYDQPPLDPHGLPDNGFFPITTFHPAVQLAYRNADNGFNAAQLVTDGASLSFGVPAGQYLELHLFLVSGDGWTDASVELTYNDGTQTVPLDRVLDWFDDPTETPGRYFLINGMDRFTTEFGYHDIDDPAVLGLRCTPDPGRQLQGVRLIRTASEHPTLPGRTVLSLLGATGVRSTTN